MTDRQSHRRISIRSVRKNPPDLNKLGRALIALAEAQAEAEAQAQEREAEKAPLDGGQEEPEEAP